MCLKSAMDIDMDYNELKREGQLTEWLRLLKENKYLIIEMSFFFFKDRVGEPDKLQIKKKTNTWKVKTAIGFVSSNA